MTHLSNPRSRHSGKIYVDARISSEDDENAFTYVNPNFNADSLDENQDCFEEGLEQIEQRWYKKTSNASPVKAMHRNRPQASNQMSNQEDNYEEMMERAEVMMVAETKRLQREEARKNNIPLLDLADSDEEEKEVPEEALPFDSLEVHPYYVQHGSRSNSSKISSNFEGRSPPSADNYLQGVAHGQGHKMSPAGDFVNKMNYCEVKAGLQCAKTHCTPNNQNSNMAIRPQNQASVNGSKPKTKPSDYNTQPISHFSKDSNNNLNLSNCNPKAFPNAHKTNHPGLHNSPYYQEISQTLKTQGNYPYHSQEETQNAEEIKKHKSIDPKPSVRKRFIYSKNKAPKSYTAMLSEKLDKSDRGNSTRNGQSRENADVKIAGCQCINNNCSNRNTYPESVPMPCNNFPRDFYPQNQGYWSEQPARLPGQLKEKSNSHRNPVPCEKAKVEQTWVSNFAVQSKVTNQNPGLSQRNAAHSSQIAKGNLPPIGPDHTAKTISAPLLAKRRPPHRIKPIDASLKVMSVSAPLNRRVKALPDLWLSSCHDIKALSNDSALPKRHAQSGRVDFITADYLEEFALKANGTNLPGTNAHGGDPLETLGTSPVQRDVKYNGSVSGSESPMDDRSPLHRTELPLQPPTSDRKSRSLAGDYRQYTLEEYKKLKREMQLGINKGSLGPDRQSEEFKEKREKLEKQKRYGSQILERNKRQMESTKQRSCQNSAREVVQTKPDPLPDKRKLAIDYAKTVPKPKAAAPKIFGKPKNPSHEEPKDSDLDRFRSNDQITKDEFLFGDLDNIRWLKERHDQERQKIAKLLPRKP